MAYRMYGVFVASLGLISILLVTDETFARGGVAVGGGVRSTHSMSRSMATRSFRHHHRNNGGGLWPYAEGYYGPSDGEPAADIAPTTPSGNVHYTYTYDVPWDWAHRYPPAVVPSDRPYVPGCSSEAVTVPGRGGMETVNVMRCY